MRFKAIFEYLKEKMKNNEIIKKFLNFSQIFSLIIKLNQDYNLFEKTRIRLKQWKGKTMK